MLKRIGHYFATALIAIAAAASFAILNDQGGVLRQPDLLTIGQQYAPSRAHAAQGSVCMPTTGTVSGLTFAQAVNTGLAALISSNSGSVAPANDCSAVAVKGQWWVDTSVTPNLLKQHNGTTWVVHGALDTVWTPPVGGGVGSIASAGTTDLGSVAQAYINVTGTTTITSFGSSAVTGTIKYLKFGSALTLTHNATSLIIPAGVNLSVSAGDQVAAVHLGSGNWGVVSVTRASGEAVINPAIEVGSYQMYGGFSVPNANYLEGDGTTVTRATYPTLLARYTSTQTGTRTSGSPTITSIADTSQYGVGQAVEGVNLQAASVIVSKTTTSITLDKNATGSGNANFTVFAYGNGNGSTTFHLPNCQGRVVAGQEPATPTRLTATYFGASSTMGGNQLGAVGGLETNTLTAAQLAAHSHPNSLNDPGHLHGSVFLASNVITVNSGIVQSVAAQATANVNANTTSITINNNNNTGGGNPHPIVQPTIIAKCLVRVQ